MSDQRVIATAGIISVGVGSANSIMKHHRAPSSRFLIGSGVAYLALSALAQGEPEIAKGLALGVMTTIVLGEGGGLLSYIDQRGEVNNKKDPPTVGGVQVPEDLSTLPNLLSPTPPVVRRHRTNHATLRPDTLTPIPGLPRRVVIHRIDR